MNRPNFSAPPPATRRTPPTFAPTGRPQASMPSRGGLAAPPATASAPPTPTAFAVTGLANGVSVQGTVSGSATSVDVWRALKGGSLTHLAFPLTLPYLDGTAVPGTLYDYAIRARNASGNSGFTATKNAGVADVMQDLWAFYGCNQASGDLVDDGPGGLTMTNVNGVTFAAGIRGNAANFVAASSQRFERAVAGSYPVTDTLSLSFWIKRTDHTRREGIFSVGDNGALVAEFNTNSINVCFGGLTNFVQFGTPADENWHYFKITYDGTQPTNELKLELQIDGVVDIDGIYVGTLPASITPTGKLYFGQDFGLLGNYLDGMLDEILIGGLKLTPIMGYELYLRGVPAAFPFSWFDDSTVYFFDTMNGPDGTLVTAHTPAPTNPHGLSWQGHGNTSGFVLESNVATLAFIDTVPAVTVDLPLTDFTVTYTGSIGDDLSYAAVELVTRFVDTGNSLWFHIKFNGDFELLSLIGGSEGLVQTGGWTVDRLDHEFVLKVRGDHMEGYVDGARKWQCDTVLFAGETKNGFAQHLPGSAATGATCLSYEVTVGEQFPPYPLGP